MSKEKDKAIATVKPRVLNTYQSVQRCTLTDDEVDHERVRALECSREIERLGEELKAKAQAIKAQIADVRGEFGKARNAAERGWVDRFVDCERSIDAAGMVTEYRLDTGEAIGATRVGTPSERQETMKGLGDPSPKPQLESRPDKVQTATEIAAQNAADFAKAKAEIAANPPKAKAKAKKGGKDAAAEQGASDDDDFGAPS